VTITRVTVGLVPARAVPVLAPNRDPRVAVAFFGLLATVGFAFAAFNDQFAFRVLMGALAVMFLAIAVFAGRTGASIAPGRVRYEPDVAELRFVPTADTYLWYFVIAVAGVLPGAAVVMVGLPREVLVGGLVLPVVTGASLIWLGQQLWALRTPRGLALSERGLRGVRNSQRLDLAWEDLAGAEAVSAKQTRLHLNLVSGGVVVVVPTWTGSDPRAVARVVEFFLAHPEQRAALSSPRDAVALVEQSARDATG
jgi:heme A synthase